MVFYGGHPKVKPDLPNLHAPVLGLYAEKDNFVTPALVGDLERQAKALGKDIEVASDHRKRNARNAERLASGEIYEVADSLKTMAKLSKSKTLSPEEQQTMSRSRYLIIKEIAHVTKLTTEDVEMMIDDALAGKKTKTRKLAA